MTALPATVVESPGELELVRERARGYVQDSKAPATWRAYRSDWRHFAAWCASRGLAPLPAEPETVAYYLADHAETLKPSTLGRRLAAIAQAHQAAKHPSPTTHVEVKLTMGGIRRQHGTAQRQVKPATTDVLRRMVGTLDARLIGTRDRALLLLGFACALRRSELVSLDVADVEDVAEGLRARLRRSKTDQEGEGRTIGVPYGGNPDTCPVRAWRAWIEAAGIDEGPAFRPVTRHGALSELRLSDRAVAIIVKRCAERAGLDPADYSGHSLRAGLVTSAAAAGVPAHDIMRTSGHKSMVMLHRYIREGSLFRHNAAAAVGL